MFFICKLMFLTSMAEHYQHLPTMTMRPTQTSYVGLGHELSMLQHCLELPMRVTIASSGH